MRDPGLFDAFYTAARQRLLLQAFALTGDLGAAKRAVRDGYVAAWHHWHKVARQDDPEAWVRPVVWQHAQRRHTAHFWRREGSLAPEHRATLDALDELTAIQRRALLLHLLAGLDSETLRHEIGLTEPSAARQLRLAIAQFAIHRDIEPDQVEATLRDLGTPLEMLRRPRASIIRRTGTARRRAHTSVGVAMAGVVTLGAGLAVSHDATATASIAGPRGAAAGSHGTPDAVVQLDPADLLAGADVTQLAARPLDETGTGNNTDGTGLNLPCQPRRFADPKAMAALVRHFEAPLAPKRPAPTRLVQVVERSASAHAATSSYDGMLAWFSDCAGTRMQLIDAWTLAGAGDQGALLVLRDWAKPVTTWTIGVTRTGSIVTTLARSVADDGAPVVPPFLAAVGTAVNRLCKADGGGSCATGPTQVAAPPPPGPSARGMLQAVDLPPVKGVPQAWVGTAPHPATTNPAATSCDRASFTGAGITSSLTRTFLMPQANLPAQFGLSETIGRFGDEGAASAFVSGVEKKMKSCEDRDLSATVDEFRHQPAGPLGAVHAWRITVQISDKRSIDFWVALVRRGAVVAEVGFVPVEKAKIDQPAFQDLAERALLRLENLPPA
jgi:DNA-directed RNA polymerase specialized sigma24 family protein